MHFFKKTSLIIAVSNIFLTPVAYAITIQAESWGEGTLYYYKGTSFGMGSSSNSYSTVRLPAQCELVNVTDALTRWGNLIHSDGYWESTTPTISRDPTGIYSVNWHNGDRSLKYYKDWEANFHYRCKGALQGNPQITITTSKLSGNSYSIDPSGMGKSASISFPDVISLGDIPQGKTTSFTHTIKPGNISGPGVLKVGGVTWTSGVEYRTENNQVSGVIKADGHGDITPKPNFMGAFVLPVNVSIEVQ